MRGTAESRAEARKRYEAWRRRAGFCGWNGCYTAPVGKERYCMAHKRERARRMRDLRAERRRAEATEAWLTGRRSA